MELNKAEFLYGDDLTYELTNVQRTSRDQYLLSKENSEEFPEPTMSKE